MNNRSSALLAFAAATTILSSCTKMKETGILKTADFSDNTAALKSSTDVTMGVAVDFTPFTTDASYSAVAKRDFSSVTFSYNMKHGAIVQDNGTLNFTNADAMVTAAGDLAVFGHTLGWHQNQNATYLKNYSGITVPAATELLGNPGFESGLTGWSTFNSGNPAGTATITTTTVAAEVHGGTTAMKVVNPTAYPGLQYQVQVSSSAFATVVGQQYTVSYWVRAASANGSIRLSTGPTGAQYQGDQAIGTAWQLISYQFTATLTSTTFLFDMGQAANTYYIDDASVKQVVTASNTAQIAAKLDTALGNFITNTVNHYKTKVKAWDVVNELFADNGALRTNSNTAVTASDVLVWSNYMGRDYALKAFNYARAADPSALLFINDYDLESGTAKVDSLIAMVKELKGKGAKIDGIGTQMHIAWNTSNANIDAMMQKLANTGLLVRISELDVKINPLFKAGFVLTPLQENYQATMYKYVVQSYLKYIPKAQQYGITVWGITDNTSWLYKNGQEYPLMYNKDYSKKQAYAAVLQALTGK